MVHQQFDDRMMAILERLNAVMDMTSLPSEPIHFKAQSNSTSNKNGCSGWDCFSKLNDANLDKSNDTTTFSHQQLDDVRVIKNQDNNFIYDSWWQGQDSIHWEAAALGLASIFIGLGMVGLLLSICSACLRQRRAQMLISRQSRRRVERYSSRAADGKMKKMNY